MACEKHRQSLNDASLGELDPKRELELLAHAAECDACRESYEHAKELRVKIDQAIGAMVAGEPSAHFASRLRARVAAEPAAARVPWIKWAPIAAATLALTALLLTSVLRMRRHSVAPDVAALAPLAAPIAPSTPPAANPAPIAEVAAPRRSGSHAPMVSAQLTWHEPEVPQVLVTPGQLAGALELSNALSDKRVDGPKLVAAANRAGEPLKVNELSVPPLTKPAPLVDLDEDSGSF